MLVSIVVPVYNGEKTIEKLSKGIDAVFKKALPEDQYEIIFVHDRGPDGSWKVIENLAHQNPKCISGYQLSRNFGQQAATLCGMSKSKGDYVITMDEDLQHSPEDIPVLLEQKNCDIVIGKFRERKESFLNKWTGLIKNRFDEIVFKKKRDLRLSSFRLIKGSVCKQMVDLSTSPFPYIPTLMFEVTEDIENISVEHSLRDSGETGYSFRKRLKLFSNLLINNSSFLLKSLAKLGLLILFFAFLLSSYYLGRYFFLSRATPGWTSLIIVSLFFGGMNLCVLGVIGEYLSRIIKIVEKKPVYLISKEIC